MELIKKDLDITARDAILLASLPIPYRRRLNFGTGVWTMSLACKHCLDCTKNEIGEKVAFCEIWGEWKSITLGDCFGNCESQDSFADFLFADMEEIIDGTD